MAKNSEHSIPNTCKSTPDRMKHSISAYGDRSSTCLYRYLSTGQELKYVRAILERGEMFFGYPSSFNDPFDCALPITFPDLNSLSSTDEKDLQEYYRFLMPYKHEFAHTHATEEDIRRETDFGIAQGNHRNRAWCNTIAESLPDSVAQSAKPLGVACLTEDPKSIPMWSYYADKHRGVVLVFDRDVLREEDGHNRCFPIAYSDTFPSLREFLDAVSSKDPLEIGKLFYCRKHRCWGYEREWRLFVTVTDTDLKVAGGVIKKMPAEVLTGVILGCMMEKSDKETIGRWATNRNESLRIYEAVRSHRSFDLIINQVI